MAACRSASSGRRRGGCGLAASRTSSERPSSTSLQTSVWATIQEIGFARDLYGAFPCQGAFPPPLGSWLLLVVLTVLCSERQLTRPATVCRRGGGWRGRVRALLRRRPSSEGPRVRRLAAGGGSLLRTRLWRSDSLLPGKIQRITFGCGVRRR